MMARAKGGETSGDTDSGHGQIAGHVEEFVPRTFVAESQLVVDGAIVAEDEQFLERRPLSEPLTLKLLCFILEKERSRASDRVDESVGRERQLGTLTSDRVIFAVIE